MGDTKDESVNSISEETEQSVNMNTLTEETGNATQANSQKQPPKQGLSYKQRRSRTRWVTPAGRVQTPRTKRARTHTESLSSVEGTPTPFNLHESDERDPSDPHIIGVILAELTEMREQLQDLSMDNKRLEDKFTKLDCLSRKNNLKIWNILEGNRETKYDIKRTVMSLLEEYGVNLNARDIGNVYRLGPKRPDTPRCTMVHFFHAEDKELVKSRGKQIYFDYNVRLEDDFPPEIEANRKELKPVLRAAAKYRNEKGERKYNAYLNVDKLHVNGRTYTVENTQNLPQELKLENISTPRNENITAFFTKNSPLSNHFAADQKIQGMEYSSNEQYYMHQKALTFGDIATAEDVLNVQNPITQKSLCKKFDKRDQTAWYNKRIEVMETGLKAKFDQNPELADFLVATGNTNILECNPGDSFWGIGMALNNPNIWVRNSWAGKAENHLGKLLMGLRTELKRIK